MKNKNACALAALFLAIILVTATINYIYVQNTYDLITDAIDLLPGEPSEASLMIADIQSLWERRRGFLELTISTPCLESISSLFEEISIAAECNNTEEYQKAMARLMRAIADIKDLETISIENIF